MRRRCVTKGVRGGEGVTLKAVLIVRCYCSRLPPFLPPLPLSSVCFRLLCSLSLCPHTSPRSFPRRLALSSCPAILVSPSSILLSFLPFFPPSPFDPPPHLTPHLSPRTRMPSLTTGKVFSSLIQLLLPYLPLIL